MRSYLPEHENLLMRVRKQLWRQEMVVKTYYSSERRSVIETIKVDVGLQTGYPIEAMVTHDQQRIGYKANGDLHRR